MVCAANGEVIAARTSSSRAVTSPALAPCRWRWRP
jgi:hypothetical protein